MPYSQLLNVTSDLGSGFDRVRVDVGSSQDDERYLPAGSYFIRVAPLTGVNDTSEGIYSISWEERT